MAPTGAGAPPGRQTTDGPSSSVEASGFSTYTWRPRSKQATAAAAWRSFGRQITAASTATAGEELSVVGENGAGPPTRRRRTRLVAGCGVGLGDGGELEALKASEHREMDTLRDPAAAQKCDARPRLVRHSKSTG